MKKIFKIMICFAILLTALPTQVKATTSNLGPGVEVDYISVSLKDSIDFNVYLLATDEQFHENLAYVEFAVDDGREPLYYTAEQLEQNTTMVNGRPYYQVAIPMAARQMVDKMTITAICNNDEIIPLAQVTIQDYAAYTLAHASQFSVETVNVVKAMINYGARAQVYFDYKADQLVNSILPESERDEYTKESTFPENAFADFFPQREGSVTGLNYYGSSVLLKSKAIVSHYFTLEDGHTIEEYTFKLEDQELTPVKSGDRYYVDLPDIYAEDLKEVWHFEVTRGDEVLDIYYGVLSYAYTVVESETSNHYSLELKDLMRSIYIYALEVENYAYSLKYPQ